MKLFIKHSWEQVFNYPKRKNIICTIKDSSKEEFLPIAKQYYMFGYDLYATEGTYKFLKEHDVPVHFVNRNLWKNKYNLWF